ncbi:uroporphyrinogen-III synthase [Cereibacter sphaeroides]|uniref:uroporphyrinogen-III synthase n=1 Tax=Rhodobacterales TaxID=204455 RepID=UPI000BBF19A0|nr:MULTISPECIES: uroporphyrinogen-III synthase [Paracoccaceae]MCE6960049.1 uroporphyrinogen-III synthase [Cereibacter sphaeroides]MCE6968592.1 uroporphyrinogen-III synthase [Cereibacter sphaeroides]MCE6973134.1 uroporphyrinogen-III synthase [Cereibacter sphaeroides]
MAPQSRDPLPTFLLTRPEAQGARFAAALRDAFGPDIRIVTSPLMMPEFLSPAIAEQPEALIFTSETGVEACRRLASPELEGVGRAWCVGNRTARAARAAGFEARSADGDAEALVAAILGTGERGPLLHLRGAESRGDVAGRLSAQGIPTAEAIVYDQRPKPLSAEAIDALGGGRPVLAPLFSPRTARLLAAEVARGAPGAVLWIAALSPAVAEAAASLPAQRRQIAAQPDADALLDAVKALLDAQSDA